MSDDYASLLTEDEHDCIGHLASAANLLRKIIGEGGQAEYDWAEAAMRVHALQHTVMAQAAARAFPDRYRPLGGWPDRSDR